MAKVLNCFYYMIIYVFTFIIVVDRKSILANFFFSSNFLNIILGDIFFLNLYTMFSSTLLTFILFFLFYIIGVVICDLEKDCRKYLCIPPEFPRCIGGICRCK